MELRYVILKTPCSDILLTNDNDTILEGFFDEIYQWTVLGHVIYSGQAMNPDTGYNITKSVNATGNYYVLLSIANQDESPGVKGRVVTSMSSWYGYLSIKHYPFLIFYALMVVAYLILNLVWLILILISIKNLIRLQFVILAVLLLSYSEQFLFLLDYAYMNITGNDPKGLIYVAEFVSAFKRTLARVLIVIVCLGFGTVKPRLGTANIRLLVAASLIYFSVACVTSGINAINDYEYQNIWYLRILLIIFDIAWFYWIFYALVNTRRALKLRRNTIKLALYNSLGIVLIFAAIASFALILVYVYIFLINDCDSNWNERRADLIFWPSLFLILQTAIMIIWRPSNNDKRFAFVPLGDGGDEEGALDKPLESEEGIVYRNISMAPLLKRLDDDEDLEWAEQNIPKGKNDTTESTVDTVLNTFIPSDEEREEKTREISKLH
ncbi:Transmembrane protein 87A-like [Oopsacas minuta]|uniref:Transmembrane protein 87A-like n=1 Tax=Oopsacas minuta TaxID=111878 RepID=A0AAV7JMY2_9METZ|nr:Transmembrane protein 87A-like [Oopsacas minuta]